MVENHRVYGHAHALQASTTDVEGMSGLVFIIDNNCSIIYKGNHMNFILF